jgi:hypothetical protein
MSASEHHAWVSPLEEELLRARELEAAGKAHLDAQEKRVARLKAKKRTQPSVRAATQPHA